MSTTTHLMTAAELIQLDDGLRHELVKGELLTFPFHGAEHGVITANLSLHLGTHVELNSLGVVLAGGTGFKLESDPDTVLAPDAAFISSNRVGRLSAEYVSVPPELIVEVISSSERKSQIEWRTEQWLGFGVESVWLVKLKSRTVEVVKANGDKKVLNTTDRLKDAVLPGFSVRLSDIFN